MSTFLPASSSFLSKMHTIGDLFSGMRPTNSGFGLYTAHGRVCMYEKTMTTATRVIKCDYFDRIDL